MPSKLDSAYTSDAETMDMKEPDCESGYVSGSSSDDSLPEVVFTKKHLQFLNRQLQFLEPKGVCSPIPLFRLVYAVWRGLTNNIQL
jgi:phosphoadenosine phosphosulfate reductase